jgi:hypothetical protein
METDVQQTTPAQQEADIETALDALIFEGLFSP